MDFEEYLDSTDMVQKYDDGFCPLTRKPCMGEHCAWSTDISSGNYRCSEYLKTLRLVGEE